MAYAAAKIILQVSCIKHQTFRSGTSIGANRSRYLFAHSRRVLRMQKQLMQLVGLIIGLSHISHWKRQENHYIGKNYFIATTTSMISSIVAFMLTAKNWWNCWLIAAKRSMNNWMEIKNSIIHHTSKYIIHKTSHILRSILPVRTIIGIEIIRL